MTRLWTALALAAAVAACSTTSPDVIQPGDAQTLSSVQDAVVLAVRPVTVEGSQSGLGATAGGVVGGALGSTRSSGGEQVAIATVGAVAGAVAGHAIERAATREDAVELLLQTARGDRVAIVQARGKEPLQAGDAVLLITSGGRTRVTKAPPGTPVPAAGIVKPEPLPGQRE